VQVIQYAARVLQLAANFSAGTLKSRSCCGWRRRKGNLPDHGDGRAIYHKVVKPAMIDCPKAVAHYAISSLFAEYGQATRVFSFTFEDERREVFSSGKTKLVIGRTRIVSEITQESEVLSYAILYTGEHNLTGGVRAFRPRRITKRCFGRSRRRTTRGFPQIIRLIDRHFGHSSYC